LSDGGKTWHNAQSETLELPLTEADNPALVAEYESKKRNCYMRCLRFTPKERPVILFMTSSGYESGPKIDPRTFTTARWTGSEWQVREAMPCDNNYDFADLEIRDDGVWQISGATEQGPQAYNTGGEVAIWTSEDEGKTWKMQKQFTKNSKYNHNFPRRPVNSHEDFYLLWADGQRHHGGPFPWRIDDFEREQRSSAASNSTVRPKEEANTCYQADDDHERRRRDSEQVEGRSRTGQ